MIRDLSAESKLFTIWPNIQPFPRDKNYVYYALDRPIS